MSDTTAQVDEAFQSLIGLRSFSQELDKLPPGQARLDDEAFLGFCFKHCHRSSAQLFQDLFVAYELREKQNGFFVEFGATDGVELSNTFLLEKGYQWRGILAEPARPWHERLRRNRGCIVDTRCVWSKSGEALPFNETPLLELSTVERFSASDCHGPARVGGNRYEVASVTLNDLLTEHGAPREIDYLSVDTEGSELEVLKAFDFGRRLVRIITVEHNMAPAREQIHALLAGKGYRRKFAGLSQWDDWYVAS